MSGDTIVFHPKNSTLGGGGGGGKLPFTELKRYYREVLAHLTIALIYMVIKTGFAHKRKLKES